MKKHNEGYTLALVLVVLIILCLLSSAIMTFAVQNLKNQRASAQRDQDHYTAAGVLEESVGKLQAFAKKNEGIALIAAFDLEEGIFLLKPLAESQTENQDDATVNEVALSGVEDVQIKSDGLMTGRLNLTLASVSGSTRIECTLQLMATVKSLDEENMYALTNFTGVEYVSYAMSVVAEGGDGDAQPEE